MKIPAKTEYSLKALLALAGHYGDGRALALSKIANDNAIPEKFLLQLMLKLKHEKLVKSFRGMAGGYILAKKPEEIRVKDIIEAVDEAFFDHMSLGKRAVPQIDAAVTAIWKKLNETVDSYFSEMTLQDILDDVIKPESVIYNI